MRLPLAELVPAWLATQGRERMGVSFDCLEHPNCRVEFWFLAPIDGEASVTESAERRLYEHDGGGFTTLSIYPPQVHRGFLVIVFRGWVSTLDWDS
jgi:hypothetical protein